MHIGRGLTLVETLVLLCVVVPLAVLLILGCGTEKAMRQDQKPSQKTPAGKRAEPGQAVASTQPERSTSGGGLLTEAQRRRRQAPCRTLVKGFANGMELYATEGNDVYPCLGDSKTTDAAPQQWKSRDDFWKNEADCNIQHYWLLVGEGHLSDAMFQCPSDEQYEEPEHGRRGYGFDSWRNASYGFQPATRHRANAAFPQDNMRGGVIIIGDKPGPNRWLWNANHPGRGGNFLEMSWTARWIEAPDNDFGVNDNNVYLLDMNTAGGVVKATTEGLPRNLNDSFLHWVDK